MKDLTRAEMIYCLTGYYKNLCINISDFTEFLKPDWHHYIDPCTTKKELQNGLYCSVGDTKIWVSLAVKEGHIRVSDEEIFNAIEDDSKWTPEIPIHLADQIERMLKLKTFW